MGKLRDLSGMVFGRLTVKTRAVDSRKYVYWECYCVCGNIAKVRGDQLTRGVTNSCGCLHKERSKESASTHGDSRTSLYQRYFKLIQRCNNPNDPMYKNYGDRGIRNEFTSFDQFKEWAYNNGYEEELTLDRRDNDGNYSPENCRWVTNKTQQSNKRSNIIIEVDGKSQTLTEWANETGIPYHAMRSRIQWGWSDEDVVTMPLMENGKVYKGKRKC